jgi:hypothetical protein
MKCKYSAYKISTHLYKLNRQTPNIIIASPSAFNQVNGSLKNSTATCQCFFVNKSQSHAKTNIGTESIIKFWLYQNSYSFLDNPCYGHCYCTCHRNQNVFCQNLQVDRYCHSLSNNNPTKVHS